MAPNPNPIISGFELKHDNKFVVSSGIELPIAIRKPPTEGGRL
jgi:hypothetical protein